RFVGHEGYVHWVGVSPGGKAVASTGDDCIYIWKAWCSKEFLRASRKHREQFAASSWSRLGENDGREAYDAECALVEMGEDAVAVLRSQLRAVPVAERGQVAKLLSALDDEEFAVRQNARAKLEKLGESAEDILRRALTGSLSVEARNVVQQLIGSIEEER